MYVCMLNLPFVPFAVTHGGVLLYLQIVVVVSLAQQTNAFSIDKHISHSCDICSSCSKYMQGSDLSGFFLISGFFVTKISAILPIFSPILCVLAQFYAIFQDFFITFRIFPEKLITPLYMATVVCAVCTETFWRYNRSLSMCG